MSEHPAPPTADLYRFDTRGGAVEVRDDEEGRPVIFGYGIRTNEWTEIDSSYEGHFMERVAPGSASFDGPKLMFQHGKDPELGEKLLGAPVSVTEDEQGYRYEARAFRGVPEMLIDGIRQGAYGASFRFSVTSEEFNKAPGKSEYNPDGIPERTITGMRVPELGPVTFPAYAGATAGVRSVSDEMRPARETIAELIDRPGELAALIEAARAERDESASIHPHDEEEEAEALPEEPPPASRRQETQGAAEVASGDIDGFRSVEELEARLEEVKSRQRQLDVEFGTLEFTADARMEWDDLAVEQDAIEKRLRHLSERKAQIARASQEASRTEVAFVEHARTVQITRDKRLPEDIYDLGAYRQNTRDAEEEKALKREGATKAMATARFEGHNREQAQTQLESLLATTGSTPGHGTVKDEVAERVLTTGSPLYRRAMGHYLQTQGRIEALFPEEQRALALGAGGTGGFAVVYELDPTLVHTSNYSINPWRELARNVQIAGTNEWKALTSGAIASGAAYSAEATESVDNSPTLAQPDIIVEKAQAFIPFSIEVGQDWEGLQGEMASLIQDAKDDLEATKFATGAGHGSNEPKGVLTGATNTTGTGTTAAFVLADLYKVWEALPPRFRPAAQYAGNLFILDKIRQFDTSGGSGVWIGPMSFGLQPGTGGQVAGTANSALRFPLLGRGIYEATAMAAVLTTTSKILLVGDFSKFVIVDRVGMNIEILPLVVGTNHRPTGQRGLYAYWRNSSDVMTASAFQVLVT